MMLSKGSVAAKASTSVPHPHFQAAAPRSVAAPVACRGPTEQSGCSDLHALRASPVVAMAGKRRVPRPVQASSVDVKQPTPVVRIDNQSDAFATIVSVQYGDKLGELLETVTALKNLSLNIRRAKVASKEETSFYVTEAVTSEKVLKSSRLEEIRMTVLNSLVETFPESADYLGGMSPASEPKWLGRREVIPTTIQVDDSPNGAASILKINTMDRPGLLVDIVRVLKDINLNVVSAEVDTVGNQAQDEFFVTYHGEPLSGPMVLLVTNALQYYLSLGELATEESY